KNSEATSYRTSWKPGNDTCPRPAKTSRLQLQKTIPPPKLSPYRPPSPYRPLSPNHPPLKSRDKKKQRLSQQNRALSQCLTQKHQPKKPGSKPPPGSRTLPPK